MMLPKGFVYLNDPRIFKSMAYATPYNFLGRVVKGYQASVCILTEQAATALIKLQTVLDQQHPGLCIKIFDAYRPVRSVTDFIEWAQDPSDQKMKDHCYPTLNKPDLFEQGYISKRSAHSRGSTVDLTLVNVLQQFPDAIELDMGTPIDFFGEASHTHNPTISEKAKANRALLLSLMEAQGFENYEFEWWHFTLKNEPFPDTYFDFPIEYP